MFEFRLPDVGEGIVEGEIVRWLAAEGDTVRQDQPLVEIMTDKATVEIPAPAPGRIARRYAAEGDIVPVGAVLVEIESESAAEPGVAPQPESGGAQVLATPAVRKVAREKGIDLAQVRGSGPGGRITMEDIDQPTLRKTAEASAAGVGLNPSAPMEAPTEIVPYRGLRRRIGERMTESKRAIPHYTYVEEADFTELTRLREAFAATRGVEAGRLTYLPFVIKAVVEGLKAYPLLNSSLDLDQGVIVLKKYYNIGIATATEEGLTAPVVKQADRLSILELGREVARLAQAARDGRLKLEELRDSTFTITSLGPLGGLMATPIIHHPEVAILGVHKIVPRPVAREGQIVIRQMAHLSLSLDHRVVDGEVGAQFMRHVVSFLETPGLLALS
jgi:pyruvate dehydrogenase E2 component (dihydrolipoamide acetyltransferase)